MKIYMTKTYEVYESYGPLEVNLEDYPELKGKTEEDLNSAEFNGVVADVINDILAKAINEFENRTGDSAEPGNR